MQTYYEVIATIENAPEIMYGSFDRQDCVDEIDAEKETWKQQGYKSIKIKSRQTTDQPDKDIYPNL